MSRGKCSMPFERWSLHLRRYHQRLSVAAGAGLIVGVGMAAFALPLDQSPLLLGPVAESLSVAVLQFGSGNWKVSEIADSWREMPRFTIVWLICTSVFLGLVTSKLHVDLIGAPQTSVEISKATVKCA